MREVAASIRRAKDLVAMNKMHIKKPATQALASKEMCGGNEEMRRWQLVRCVGGEKEASVGQVRQH